MTPFLSESDHTTALNLGLHHVELPQDMLTPVRAFLSLRATDHKACLLESAEGTGGLARYSFLGVDPSGHFRADGRSCKLRWRDQEDSFEAAPLDGLRQAASRVRHHAPMPGLPPLTGGWIGYASWDLVNHLEPRVPAAANQPMPSATLDFSFFGDVVAFDHAAQRIHVITDCSDATPEAVEAARARATKLALDLYATPAIPGPLRLLDDEPTSAMSKEQYTSGVRDLKADIGNGEIFQAVLSRRLERRIDGDAFTLYRALRLANPAPHMFYLETSDLTLVGSSPERLVSVRDGHVETLPIAGTRPRGEDRDADDALAASLLRDPKERAEHDMLVDLARNDVGRVARVGSVRVRRYASVERFTRVQHLVSSVVAELRSGCDALDALAACFPAGTVSGAPKIRAMELITALEPEGRGAYAGAFGYLDRMGNLDTCITLRTLVVADGRVSIQAGAGIVHASDPDTEYSETLHKARALLECLDLATSPSFGPPGEAEPDSAAKSLSHSDGQTP